MRRISLQNNFTAGRLYSVAKSHVRFPFGSLFHLGASRIAYRYLKARIRSMFCLCAERARQCLGHPKQYHREAIAFVSCRT